MATVMGPSRSSPARRECRVNHQFPQGFGALPPALVERLLTPALIVRLDVARHNVATVLALLGGDADRWRPHLKTTKLPSVWALLLDAGVRQFKVATTREAACLLELLDARDVAGDVLVAYPHTGPALRRLDELARAHPRQRLAVLVEDAAGVHEAPASLGLFVDVNPGMDRTGRPLDDTAGLVAVSRACAARLRGLHVYDGHLHDTDADARREQVHAGYGRVVALLDALGAAGVRVPEVVTAGTPALPAAAAYAGLRERGVVHRVSPGTVVFHDLRSAEENPQLDLRPAAVVAARVVSHPRAGVVTVDAGSKALAAEAGDPCAVALGHPELVARSPNEEHLPFDVTSGAVPARGTLLQLVPRHVCPTVNLADEAVLLDGERVVGVVPVQARGHELLLEPLP